MRFKWVLPVILLALSSPEAYSKGFIENVWGVVADPLKIGEGSQNINEGIATISATVDRLNTYLLNLEGEIDSDIKAYIAELNLIIDKIKLGVADNIGSLDDLVQDAIASAAAVEIQIYYHTKELVTCVPVLLEQSVEVVLSDAINKLEQARPGIKLFGVRIISFSVEPNEIINPIDDWRFLMIAHRKAMATLTEDDDATLILQALGEMQRITMRTKCHYENTALEVELISAFAELQREARPWVGHVDFTFERYSKLRVSP